MDELTPQVALKEWAVAVRAMEAGRQDVIFRKGGIQEPAGDFELIHNQFLLYPAREHQKLQYIRNEFHPLFQQTKADNPGHLVRIRSSATVASYQLIQTLQQAVPYRDSHIWTDDFIQMRLDYKPDRPLYVVQLKIDLLPAPIEFVETTEQAGCRSWVKVNRPA